MWVAESTEFLLLVSCSVCVTDLGSMLTTALLYVVARAAEILRRGRVDTWTKKRRPAWPSACLRVLDIDLLQIHILHGRTPVEGETGDILPVSDLPNQKKGMI